MQTIKLAALAVFQVAMFILAIALSTVVSFTVALCVYWLLKGSSEPWANNAAWVAFGAMWITVFRAWAEVTRS